jgi:hypothetical protein
VDPGLHLFRFEREGSPAVEERLLIRQAEKNRIVSVELSAPEPSQPARPERVGGGWPVAAYVAAGVGAAAFGLFAYLALTGQGTFSRCEQSRSCSSDELDALQAKQTVAWISLGVAAAAAGTCAALVLLRPSPATDLRVRPIAGGGVAELRIDL